MFKPVRPLINLFPLMLAVVLIGGGCSQAPTRHAEVLPSDVLSGTWDMDFQIGSQTLHSTLTIKQDGNQFFGEGTDNSGRPFTIVNGQIRNDQLDFFKKYVGGNSQVPAVQYQGKISIVNEPDYRGPYLAGIYSVQVQGQPVSGQWRAQMPSKLLARAPAQTPVQANNQNPPAPSVTPAAPAAPPELSGKWNTAYEYNFGTTHSVMFLEQSNGKITGHGFDLNTNEKFAIENGEYNYPKLTMVRNYQRSKGAKSDRILTFKADVSVVNDTDYQGPYLNGKTEGGGSWEAQLVK